MINDLQNHTSCIQASETVFVTHNVDVFQKKYYDVNSFPYFLLITLNWELGIFSSK